MGNNTTSSYMEMEVEDGIKPLIEIEVTILIVASFKGWSLKLGWNH